MLCQECQQKQASLHFTKIINGEKTEFHICETCAKDKGDYIPGSNSFSIHQLLSGLLDTEQPFSATKESSSLKSQREELTCKNCGLTYHQFAEIGRFGCAECYRTFDEKLDPIFRRIHGGNAEHAGKIPKRKGKDLHVHREIENLRGTLKVQIADEEFEQAANTRDKIRSLKNNLQEKEGD